MLTVGIDLIEVTRIERVLARYGDRFLERVFTPAEILYCRARPPELAARFAAKEAVAKALGVGVRMIARDGINWRDVEVIGDMRGKPLVRLYDRAAERAGELGLTEWAVSLSHTREHAIAFVVAQ
jgi:holo-[acyl-carrier protein] synthase